jgi:hypothetical protein
MAQASVFEQCPKPSLSIMFTMSTTLSAASIFPVAIKQDGNFCRCKKGSACIFASCYACSTANAGCCVKCFFVVLKDTGVLFASGAEPVDADIKPPACIIWSKAFLSLKVTGNRKYCRAKRFYAMCHHL